MNSLRAKAKRRCALHSQIHLKKANPLDKPTVSRTDYGIPAELQTHARGYLDTAQLDVVDRFEKAYPVEIKK
jgi:hypothetical protein